MSSVSSKWQRTATRSGVLEARCGRSFRTSTARPDVLRLEEIDPPKIGDDDVLIRVQAASLHIGDWHVMAGLPYLLRVVGFGFRAPKVHVRGTDGGNGRGGGPERDALPGGQRGIRHL